MKSIRIILAAFSLFLTGCEILSLQPLYSEKDTTTEPAVIGRWKTADDNTIWKVTETKPGYYSVVEEGKSGGQLEARLTRLGKVLFADFLPVEMEACQIPGHLFARVQVDDSKMKIAWVDFKGLVLRTGQPPFPAHQFVAFDNKNTMVLTAPVTGLRAYFEKIASVPGSFQKDEIFQRQ
jgi:hypothetical protein